MTTNRYLSAILSTAIVLLTALTSIPANSWTLGNPLVAAFVALAASTIISYLVPLSSGKWPGIWKTGIAILAAIFAAVWPLLTTGSFDWKLIVLAALNALAQQLGVNVRIDDPTLTKPKEVRAQSIALPVISPAPAVGDAASTPDEVKQVLGEPPAAS
jgi:hypothetical protein